MVDAVGDPLRRRAVYPVAAFGCPGSDGVIMSIAQNIYDERFESGYGDPRSDAYKGGLLAALRFRAGEGPKPTLKIPYELGTAECDAWFAGCQEGYLLWRLYRLDSGE